MKEELKAAYAAMFANANPSIGGFDVRGSMFDVRASKTETGRRNEIVDGDLLCAHGSRLYRRHR